MQTLIDWLLDLVLWAPRWIFSEILDGLATLIESISVPDWLLAWDSTILAITSDIWWFCELFAVQEGFAIWVSALSIRFLIRRLPVVG